MKPRFEQMTEAITKDIDRIQTAIERYQTRHSPESKASIKSLLEQRTRLHFELCLYQKMAIRYAHELRELR